MLTPFSTVRRQRRGGRLASATPVRRRGSDDTGPKSGTSVSTRAWQELALEFCETIPEADYACSFFGGGLSKLVLDVQQKNPDTGEWEWIDDRADPAVTVWDRVQDPGGGREQLTRMYGELFFANGEGYLTETWDAETSQSVFEFLSVFELKPQGDDGFDRVIKEGGEKKRYKMPAGGVAPANDDEMQAWRLWRPNRRRTTDAHAPMRAVQDVCQELRDLTLSVRAQTRSRLSRASIMFLPPGLTEQDVVPLASTADANGVVQPVQPDPVDDPESNKVLSRMVDHFSDPLTDPSSVANLVPYLVSGWDAQSYGKPSDYYVQLYSTQDVIPEMALREENVKRFARGVNLPMEIILGMGAANHWTGWLIDDQTWQAHMQPEALRMVRDLTKVYLWPQLVAMNLGQDFIVQDRRVWYDEVNLVVNPDRSKDALQVHAHRAISDAALRQVTGFTPEDAPSETDPNSFPTRATSAPPLTESGDPQAGEESQLPPEEQGQTATGMTAEAWLQGAQQAAIIRCREVAGQRLRNLVTKHRYTPAPTSTAPSGLAAHIGEKAVRDQLGNPAPATLVAGGSSMLRSLLERHGWEQPAIVRACAEVEAYAAQTLYKPDPFEA